MELKVGDIIRLKPRLVQVIERDPWTNDWLVQPLEGGVCEQVSYQQIEDDFWEKVEQPVFAKVDIEGLPEKLEPGKFYPVKLR